MMQAWADYLDSLEGRRYGYTAAASKGVNVRISVSGDLGRMRTRKGGDPGLPLPRIFQPGAK